AGVLPEGTQDETLGDDCRKLGNLVRLRRNWWSERQRSPGPWPAITRRRSAPSASSRRHAVTAADDALRLGARDPRTGQRYRPNHSWSDRQRSPGPWPAITRRRSASSASSRRRASTAADAAVTLGAGPP